MKGPVQPESEMGKAGPWSAAGADFQRLFCAKHACPPHKYARRVFWECACPEGRWVIRLLRVIRPGIFQPDFDLIEQIKNVTSFTQFQRTVDCHEVKHVPTGFWRLLLRARLSHERLMHLAETVFAGRGAGA
jgi:hypothetical protein